MSPSGTAQDVRLDAASELTKPSYFDQAVDGQFNAVAVANGLPLDRAFCSRTISSSARLELDGPAVGHLDDEAKRGRRAASASACGDAGIRRREERANPAWAGRTWPRTNSRPSNFTSSTAGDRSGTYGWVGDRVIVEADGRIEPARAARPPGIAVAVIVEHGLGDVQVHAHRQGQPCRVLDSERALVVARGPLPERRSRSTGPGGWPWATRHVFAERPALVVDAAEVEAAQGGPLIVPAGPLEIAEVDGQPGEVPLCAAKAPTWKT